MRKTPLLTTAAVGLALAAPGSADAAWKCPKAVDFKVKGDGQLMQEAHSFDGKGERTPYTGTKLRTDGGFYYADGVKVVYKLRKVKFIAMPGAVFKPHCVNVSENGYNDSPSMFLNAGEAKGKAPRKGPRVNGITTFEASFYTTSKRRHRYTVSREHPNGKPSNGESTITVHKGRPMTVTPWSDVAPPGSCRPGRSMSIDHKGRIRSS